MAANAYIGTGTTLAFATSLFTCDILDISGPDSSRETIDTTHMLSVDYKEFMVSDLIDSGELKVDVSYDPTLTPFFIAGGGARVGTEVCTLTFSEGTVWTFNVVCTGFDVKIPLEDKMTASATWKVSGEIVKVDRT